MNNNTKNDAARIKEKLQSLYSSVTSIPPRALYAVDMRHGDSYGSKRIVLRIQEEADLGHERVQYYVVGRLEGAAQALHIPYSSHANSGQISFDKWADAERVVDAVTPMKGKELGEAEPHSRVNIDGSANRR